jgi:hypothetical protein
MTKTCGTCRWFATSEDPLDEGRVGTCTWLVFRIGTAPPPFWVQTLRADPLFYHDVKHNCPAWVTGASGGGLPE